MRLPLFLFSLLMLKGMFVSGQTANNSNSFPAASSADPAYLGSSTIATPLHKLYTGGSIKSFNTGNSGFSSPSLYLANTTASTGRTYFINSNSSGLLRFVDSNANADRLVINSSGNVGIGTSSPSTKLDVNGNITALNTLSIKDGSGNTGIITHVGMTTAFGNQTGSVGSSNRFFTMLDNSVGSARLYVGGSFQDNIHLSTNPQTGVGVIGHTKGGTGYEALINLNDGKVGIGTATPSAKFHVNGTSNFTDQLQVNKTAANSGIPAYLSGYSTGSRVDYSVTGAISTMNYHQAQNNVLTFAGYGGTVAAYASAATKSDLVLSNVNANLNTGYYFSGSDNNIMLLGTTAIGNGGVASVKTSAHIDATASVSSYYGLLIDQVYGAGTITNKYGVYQVDANSKNYFAGKLSIGTTSLPTDYKLAVGGNIIAEKVRVKLQSSGWPDYVFDKKYKLPSLREIELFIQQHQHLPGVPSAAEVEKEGIDLGDNQAVLLKKIEELTLHLIELSKKVDQLSEENKVMKKQLQDK